MKENVILQSLLGCFCRCSVFLSQAHSSPSMAGLQPPLCSLINGLNRPPPWISKRVGACRGRGRLEVTWLLSSTTVKELCVHLISMIMCDSFYQGWCYEKNCDIFTTAGRQASQQEYILASADCKFKILLSKVSNSQYRPEQLFLQCLGAYFWVQMEGSCRDYM